MRADTSKKISRGLELELCSSIFQRRLQELEDRLRASREFSANLALEIKINRLREETWWTDRILDWSEEKETMQMLVGPMTPWSDCCKTCRLMILEHALDQDYRLTCYSEREPAISQAGIK